MSNRSDPTGTSQSATSSDTSARRSSVWQGLGWGVVATVAMSIPMIVGMTTGVAPMPEPIPRALVTLVFGTGLPAPLLMALFAGSHLGYGVVFASWLRGYFPRQASERDLASAPFSGS